MNAALQAGRLEQSCPDCGRWEAAEAVAFFLTLFFVVVAMSVDWA